jgi:hypothetical protein
LPEGKCPLLFRGVWRGRQTPSSPREFWTCDRLTMASGHTMKSLYSISIHWEVAALWNQFWWKENSDFWQFWDIPRCHGKVNTCAQLHQ